MQVIAKLARAQCVRQNRFGEFSNNIQLLGGEHADHQCRGCPQRSGNFLQRRPNMIHHSMPVVAGEKFIATIARKSHGDMLARRATYEIRWKLAGIREWFVKHLRQQGNAVAKFMRRNLNVGVFGLQVFGNVGGVHALI